MKNFHVTPITRQPRRRSARVRTGTQIQVNKHLLATRKIISEVRALQAKTATLQRETAKNLEAIRS